MFSIPIWRFADPMFLLLLTLGVSLGVITRRSGLFRNRKTRAFCIAAWTAWALLWTLSCSGVAALVVQSLEVAEPDDLTAELAGTPPEKRLLVVLTGGSLHRPREGLSAAELIGGTAYPRSIGAARIYKEHGFGHLVVSGSAPPALTGPDGINSVIGMAEVAIAFGVPKDRVILETKSTNTRENAKYSAEIADQLGAEKIVVVTSGHHIPRARAEFERIGRHVLVAPVDVADPPGQTLSNWLPSVYGLDGTHRTLHELLGRLKP